MLCEFSWRADEFISKLREIHQHAMKIHHMKIAHEVISAQVLAARSAVPVPVQRGRVRRVHCQQESRAGSSSALCCLQVRGEIKTAAGLVQHMRSKCCLERMTTKTMISSKSSTLLRRSVHRRRQSDPSTRSLCQLTRISSHRNPTDVCPSTFFLCVCFGLLHDIDLNHTCKKT